MSFDWSEYREVARYLAGIADSNPIKEAKLRSSISRAYYAVFGKAYSYYIEQEGDLGSKDRKHAIVIEWFSSRKDRVSRDIGERLLRLRRYRNMADYDDVISENIDAILKMVLSDSTNALDQLKKLRNLKR